MPFLGHRSPDMADMGISPAGSAPVLPQDTTIEARATAVVMNVALDDEDRLLLLEALGLAPAAEQARLAS